MMFGGVSSARIVVVAARSYECHQGTEGLARSRWYLLHVQNDNGNHELMMKF